MLRAASLLILFVQAAKAEVPFDPPARIPVPGWGIPTWMRRGTKMSPKNWPTCVFWGNCIEKYGGLDQNSNPLWDATNATSEVVSAFKPVRRVIYDSDSDTMYLAGDVKEQNWGSFLRVKKFTDWSKANRNPAFTVELPYRDKEYAGNSNYGGGDPITLSVAGHYIFIGYGMGHVRILNKADGRLVGTLCQNVNAWKGSDGQVDAAYGMTVTLRKNGEYVVLFENAAWANIQMYRWCPGGACASTLFRAEDKSQ